jgi:DNA-binding response OmpR family regulator
MSDPEIAVHLRQRFREVALARVEIYVRQLRQKVDESFGQALISGVRNLGYVIEAE